MKILYFIPSLRAGGKERRLVELITYLKRETTIDIHLVLMNENIHYKSITNIGINFYIIERKIKKDPSVFFRFFSLCKKINPSIIHSWAGMTTFYAIPSKILLNIPLINNQISTSNPLLFNLSRIEPIVFRINYRFSDLMIANSQAGLNSYNLKLSNKNRVIYNGINKERFTNIENDNSLKNIWGVSTRYIIIMIASFMRNKYYDLLIDVAKIINENRKDVSFICIGDGETLDSIHNRIIIEGISNVILLGKQQYIENYILQSDIGILLTESEGVSNAIIEYMAFGKPVITNDQKGGSKEIIENDINGFITSNNPIEISNKINYLIDNLKIRTKIGENNRTKIIKDFTIEKMANEYIRGYNELVEDCY